VDGQTLKLQVWLLPRDLAGCQKQSPQHANLAEAGLWADCVRQKGPVVHEGPAQLGSGRGFPEEHPKIVREVVVPVFRNGRPVAVLGVANKGRAYSTEDVGALSQLAELAWEVTSRRQSEASHARLEEQLRLAQRMEAIGRLAGGVAHDFNNLLLVIQSCSEFLLADLQPSDPRRSDVEEIQKAGERAAALTRQLLAFSRKQMLIPRVFDLNSVVQGMVAMLERLIGETVVIRLELASEELPIKADRGQIEQVLTNLVVNARDAMPNGGVITIETAEWENDRSMPSNVEAVPAGPCALLSVADTGVGIDEDAKSQIFDPFYSTKALGKGTGLGLSTVYGIVKQSGGHVWVTSEKGKGSCFRIALPLTDEPSSSRASLPVVVPRGKESILLVEDNRSVRDQIQRILSRAGYDVTTASGGDEALLLTKSRPRAFDLVISDIIMPGISGRELSERLLYAQPQLRVLLMSGYTDQADVLAGGLGPAIHFIGKPFGADALARKVRDVLEGLD
jgi:signal transduction histidine kinase/CheY-like chemotaxis protein